jgi:hypothetical protein
MTHLLCSPKRRQSLACHRDKRVFVWHDAWQTAAGPIKTANQWTTSNRRNILPPFFIAALTEHELGDA